MLNTACSPIEFFCKLAFYGDFVGSVIEKSNDLTKLNTIYTKANREPLKSMRLLVCF